MVDDSGAVNLGSQGDEVTYASELEFWQAMAKTAQAEITRYQELVGTLVENAGGTIELTHEFLQTVDLNGKALKIEESEERDLVVVKVVNQSDITE